MNTYQEKLSLLSEMIAFARVSGTVKPAEYNFLVVIAKHFGVAESDLQQLFTHKVAKLPIKSEAERILQFHRLVLLMNIDEKIEPQEIKRLHEIGLTMGLNPATITTVLLIMHKYPNKIVPPEVLIDIFKTQHN